MNNKRTTGQIQHRTYHKQQQQNYQQQSSQKQSQKKQEQQQQQHQQTQQQQRQQQQYREYIEILGDLMMNEIEEKVLSITK